MDGFVNSFTANSLELTAFPYLNNPVDNNSQLDYNLRAAFPSQETIPFDVSHRLPTRLSKNPSKYEKELRQLVIELYSDKQLAEEELGISESTLQPDNSPAVIPIITAQVTDKGSSVQEIDGAMELGPQKASIRQPLDMKSLGGAGSEGYCSLDSSEVPLEETTIRSLSELQGYLMSFQDSSKDFEPSRAFDIADAGLLTPVFNDSGIHLEFAVSETDASDAEVEETGAEGGKRVGHDAAGFAFLDSGTNGSEKYRNGREECDTSETSRRIDPGASVGVSGATAEKLLADEESMMSENYHELSVKRAGLEGKLELLQQEFSSVLEDRKSLQSRLQAVETRLKEEVQKASQTNPAEISLVYELERKNSDLETKLRNLHGAYEENHSCLISAHEELNASEVTIGKLKEHLSSVEGEIDEREQTIGSLQNEIESLKKWLDEAKVQNENLGKENQTLNSDVSSLVQAKEWLKKQLSLAHDARTKLQLRSSEHEAIIAGKSQLIEQLRCESARTSQQLTEMQQNSLAEKAQLLKHLEQVEEDIGQQTLVFKEAEIQGRRVEQTLNAKIGSLMNENDKLTKLMNSTAEMKQELEAAKQDVLLKEALLDAISKDKEEMKEQLRLARESSLEYKRSVDELGLRFKKTKEELRRAQENTEAKDCFIEKLEEEKRFLEGNLEVANNERAACHDAIHSLRLDLEKVDRRFKLMKRELTAKGSQLEETVRQKDGFVSELRILREGFENQLAKSNALREEFVQREKLVEDIQQVKDELEKEVVALTQQVTSLKEEVKRIEEEKNGVQGQLQSALSEIVQLEEKFHKSLLARARLEGELETTRKTNGDEINALRNQNARLKEEREMEQINLQRDVLKERDHAINLEQELKVVKDEMVRTIYEYNNKLQAMKDALQVEKNLKEAAEDESKKLCKISERRINEIRKTFDSKRAQFQNDLVVVQQDKEQLEQAFATFQKSSANRILEKNNEMNKLETELFLVKKELMQRKAEVEKLQMCAIEVEREKGRLAGVLASQKTLREHVIRMEKEVAVKETALLEVTSEADGYKAESESQQKAAYARIGKLETMMRDQRRELQDLRDKFGKERRENVTLRREIELEKREREEFVKKLNATEKETQSLRENLNQERNDAKSWLSQLEITKRSLDEQEVLTGELKRRLTLHDEQEKAKENQMETLEWEAGQRAKEVEFLKEQLKLVEERQQLELENLKTALQVSRSEATSLRTDLSDVRKLKCNYQTQTFELKDAILSARQLTEMLKQELFDKSQELAFLLNNVLSAKNLDLLQEEVASMRDEKRVVVQADGEHFSKLVPTISVRPVSSLQECMASLRSQIGNLQKQINDHADSVQTASTSWRSFKESIHQLQASCSSQDCKQLRAERDKI